MSARHYLDGSLVAPLPASAAQPCRLMAALDTINRRFGSGTIGLACRRLAEKAAIGNAAGATGAAVQHLLARITVGKMLTLA